MALSEEQKNWLALTLVPGVGSAGFIRLLARFRTPGDVLRASVGELAEVVDEKLADRIHHYADAVDLTAQERAVAEYDVDLITLEDPSYPVRLAEIYDPPLVLFTRGELRDSDERGIAIVGTRRASPYGLRLAERFARELAARGITIVSGMAAGIDAAAHRGALDAGGRTIAVLGNGVDVVYPRENAGLMEAIIQSGCVISQFPMGMESRAEHFPYRNRIISGISMGTLIVEAPLRSGALITAKLAAEQGREVFATPGPVGAVNSQGPHRLIQEGAKLVESVEDILVELDLPETRRSPAKAAVPDLPPPAPKTAQAPRKTPAPPPTGATRSGPPLTPAEENVLSVLAPEGSYVDEIALACRIPVSEALSSLTVLELKGMVRQFSGKRFAPR